MSDTTPANAFEAMTLAGISSGAIQTFVGGLPVTRPACHDDARMIASAHTLEASKLGIKWGEKFVVATITASVTIRNDDVGGRSIDDLLAAIEKRDDAIARRIVEGNDEGATVLACQGTIEAGTSIPTGTSDGINFEFSIIVQAVLNWN